MTDTQTQYLDELIARFDNAMLVTRCADGELHARPMTVAEHRDHAALYFATSRRSEKIKEVHNHAEVAVTMQGGHRYLSLSGRAEVVSDHRLIERLFSSGWKIWFPDGPNDPDLVPLKIEPVSGEYWDMGTQRNRMRFMVEAGKAMVQDRVIDTEYLTGHGQVDLD
jgi:general stress protein 26